MSINNEGFSYDDYVPGDDCYTMSCDNCGAELFDSARFVFENGCAEFDSLIRVAKREGWRFTKDESGEWYHYCPSCAKRLNLRIGPSAAQDFEGVGSQ